MTPHTIRYGRAGLTAIAAAALTVGAGAGVAAADQNQLRAPASTAQICDYQPASANPAEQSAIDQRYESDGELQQLLGAPVGEEVVEDGVHYREYDNGRLYWTEATGVRATYGQIMQKYLGSGGHHAYGVPITDECPTADGVGRYNHFTGTDATGTTSVYWHPDHGAHLLYGAVREHWEAAGWETGTYGYPTSDTQSGQDGSVLFADFTGDDGHGASIYWTPDSGVHGVKGAIRSHWLAMEGPGSYLGYPTSSEFDTPNGKRTNFQGGYVTWDAETGGVQDFPW